MCSSGPERACGRVSAGLRRRWASTVSRDAMQRAPIITSRFLWSPRRCVSTCPSSSRAIAICKNQFPRLSLSLLSSLTVPRISCKHYYARNFSVILYFYEDDHRIQQQHRYRNGSAQFQNRYLHRASAVASDHCAQGCRRVQDVCRRSGITYTCFLECAPIGLGRRTPRGAEEEDRGRRACIV